MKINRRTLLKSGLFSFGGMAAFPHWQTGPFPEIPAVQDHAGRIYLSPLVREYAPDPLPSESAARLNANENPYGPPPSARKAISEGISGGNRYPGRELNELIQKIAAREGVGSDHIMAGPGSSDLLEKTAMTLFARGGNLVSADPTFMSIIRVAQAVGATWKAVPCRPDWSLDLEAMEKAIDSETRLVYVCNPNNPVGTAVSAEALTKFCLRVSGKVPVFVDEAYLELAEGATGSMIGLLRERKNVIICRTFSKIMGMAGLRIGYLAALPSTLQQLRKITNGGGGISYSTILAASAAFDDREFQNFCRTRNTEVRNYLCSELRALGHAYIPSCTNFVIFPSPLPGKELLARMAAGEVAVRAFDIADKPWCRVSIGTMDEIRRFVTVLKTLA